MMPTRAELDILLDADHRMRQMGWYLTTSRNTPLRIVRRLVAKGFLRELDELVVMQDDDGFTKDPERYREGYELTEKAKALLAAKEPSAARGEGE